jgi:hypothetical protein
MGLGLGSYFLSSRARRSGSFPFYGPTTDEEAAQLKAESSSLKEWLNSIDQRLSELEKQKGNE